MSVAKSNITQLLRPIFEAKPAIAWGFAFLWCLLVALIFKIGFTAAVGLLTVTAAMAGVRSVAAMKLAKRQMALIGKEKVLIPASTLFKALPKMEQNIWMGWGWRWEPSHRQLAYEIMKRDLDEIYPPKWMLRLLGEKRNPAEERGLQWVHGLEPDEGDILVPLDALKGHCAIIATTGAIKTRLMALIVPQLVARGDVVIVIDPKGDKDLKEICRMAAASTGEPDKFMLLHPAFAKQSIRMDLLKNWDRSSQVASRVQLVLNSEDSTFTQFCWMAVHRITNAVKFMGRRVSILTLKNAMESRSTVEQLAYEALKKFFTELKNEHLLQRVEQELSKANSQAQKGGAKKGSGLETSIPELTAMINVFIADIPENKEASQGTGLPPKHPDIMGLIAVLEAPKDWFGKMVVSITPMLNKLTTDDLNELLSPDYTDLDDPRPIMDMKRIVEGRHVLYIGTDALADTSVAKALTSMALADLSSVASEIFNHGLDGGKRNIHLIVDEWGDAMCEPLIQQANKGRGADMFIWALGQTFSDLVVAFGGDVASAKRFMGNMNNLIVGAIQDLDTVKMVSEKFGETSIMVESESKGLGSKTEDTGMEFSANHGRSIGDKDAVLIPQGVFMGLADLHYVGLLNRTMRVKGRIPVVVPG